MPRFKRRLTEPLPNRERNSMRKISLFLAMVLLFLSLVSCSSALTPEPEEENTEESSTQALTKDDAKEDGKKILQESDPAEDDVINVLMIGSSSCYYYVEELHGIAKAAGINMKVCNVYYSGCTLKQHWTWWKLNESHYEYFETDENGRRRVLNLTNLQTCLVQENWDMISFQQRIRDTAGDLEKAKSTYYRYLSDLYEYVSGQFPRSKYYWHDTWAYQIGYDRNGFVVDSAEKQAEMASWSKNFAIAVCQDYPLTRVPGSDAWQYARQDARVGDVLCNRGAKSDLYHDGEEGGGQYLNGCVWFETLTGKSCIGNTYRPDTYNLSEDKIAALQEAAHRAVEESRA